MWWISRSAATAGRAKGGGITTDVQKTIEFILDMQAKTEERWAKAERLVERFARAGVSLRRDVREVRTKCRS